MQRGQVIVEVKNRRNSNKACLNFGEEEIVFFIGGILRTLDNEGDLML